MRFYKQLPDLTFTSLTLCLWLKSKDKKKLLKGFLRSLSDLKTKSKNRIKFTSHNLCGVSLIKDVDVFLTEHVNITDQKMFQFLRIF